MLFTLLRFSLLSLAALPLAWAEHQPHSFSKRHHEISKRAPSVLEKRAFSPARFTFYSTGLGACGDYNSDSDFIVALNSDQYGSGYPGPECNKQIIMSYNGKTTTATIKDECPGCPYAGLDLSPGLFSFFAPQSEGVLYGSWYYADGSGGGGGGSSPSTTSTWVEPTTSTTHTTTRTTSSTPAYTPPSTTSTTHSKTKTSTTTSSTHTSTSKTSTSTTSTSTSHSSSSVASSSSFSSSAASSTIISSEGFSNSAASALAVATGTLSGSSSSSTDAPSNLNDYAEAVLGMAGMVVQGAMIV